MKFSNLLFAIVLAFEATNSEVIKNNAFSYNFHCSNSSLCRILKKELSNAINSISSLMDFTPIVQFEAVADDISKYSEDTKKETLAVALDKDFVPLDSVNSNIMSPYPGSRLIMNEISSDVEDNDFILVLNNFKSDKKVKNFFNLDYRNNFMKVTLDSLSILNRLEEPYSKMTKVSTFNNTDIIKTLEPRLNETSLLQKSSMNDELNETYRLNKLYTIFHWKNRLISEGNPTETAKYPYKRVIAIGDVHGDCDKLINILRHANLINRNNDWIAYNTALVQVGDLFDIGSDVKRVLDLLIKLKDQAKRKRSVVHFLLGDHEIYNLRGRYTFITATDINSFDGLKNREEALSINGKYGKVIRTEMNVALVLNDSIFVHSGLAPEFAEMGIDNINKHVKDILTNAPTLDELYEIGMKNGTHPLYTDPILSNKGPLFDRAFADEDDSVLCPKIEKTLQITNTKRMIVGHNTQDYGEIKTRCNDKIIYIDIGLSSFYGDFFGYLEILNDKNQICAIYNN